MLPRASFQPRLVVPGPDLAERHVPARRHNEAVVDVLEICAICESLVIRPK